MDAFSKSIECESHMIIGHKPSEKMPALHCGDTVSAAWEESKPCLVLLRCGQTAIARSEMWDDDEQVTDWYLCNSDHLKISHQDVVLWAYLPEWDKSE